VKKLPSGQAKTLSSPSLTLVQG